MAAGSFRPALETDVDQLLEFMRALHLEVETGNERAHALYRRSGFAERGLRLMTKRLTP